MTCGDTKISGLIERIRGMASALACALLLAPLALAQTSQTRCYPLGAEIHCDTINYPTPAPMAPATPFDPSVIRHIGDTPPGQDKLLCIQRAAAAGLTREQVLAMCLH